MDDSSLISLLFQVPFSDWVTSAHIYWSTLAERPSASDPTVSFYRALKRGQSRQFTLCRKYQVRVLVVISNPPDLPGVKSPYPIDVAVEKDRAEKGFTGLDVKILATSATQPGNTCLDRILSDLDDGYDILYLVCHAALDERFPDTRLSLEDPEADWIGSVAGISSAASRSSRLRPSSSFCARVRPLAQQRVRNPPTSSP